jgi:hypothetical protein
MRLQGIVKPPNPVLCFLVSFGEGGEEREGQREGQPAQRLVARYYIHSKE